MTTIDLYVYANQDGSITVTPTARNQNDTPGKYRLIASEGHVLTNGVKRLRMVDTDSPNSWSEVRAQPSEIRQHSPRISDAEALRIITGGAE